MVVASAEPMPPTPGYTSYHEGTAPLQKSDDMVRYSCAMLVQSGSRAASIVFVTSDGITKLQGGEYLPG